MKHFKWNIKFLLPVHFVTNLLANGVIFDNEVGADTFTATKINEATNKYLDTYVKNPYKFEGIRPSLISAGIIYCCRKE